MPFIIVPTPLVMQAARLLNFTNQALADHLGVSRRTVQRWLVSGTGPQMQHAVKLACTVYPRHEALARELAIHGGTTVEALGLVPPRPPPPPAAPAPRAAPVPPPAPAARSEHAEAVLCAAANAMDVSPARIAPAVVAAFKRALALGVDVPSLVALLEPPKPAASPQARPAG
ncbi:MAG TPA: helix-turn-helix transcriptional regulator [Myxococcales bacterium]|nr:helix-turn-helix transcriptional regulator [Myxococcales bacterium]